MKPISQGILKQQIYKKDSRVIKTDFLIVSRGITIIFRQMVNIKICLICQMHFQLKEKFKILNRKYTLKL
jgi:hypothetical protein